MLQRSPLLLLTCALATGALLAPAGAHARTPRGGGSTHRSNGDAVLLHSPELWATIDVCNTAKQPDTIGIRGSMPGDGHAHEKMYMRFQLERLSAVNQWVEEAHSPYTLVGSASKGLQSGVSFTPQRPKGVWRGRVDFKWVNGKTLVGSASKLTTRAHEVTGGAEPAAYSASTCTIK